MDIDPTSEALSGRLKENFGREACIVFFKTKEEFGGLSNMAAGFELQINNDDPIRTSEALYQACRFPHRPELQAEIIEEKSPMAAKMKSKPHRNDSRPDWEEARVAIMRWCLEVKLVQNWEKFSELLLSTGDKPIVEESRRDDFWGAIPFDDYELRGQNVLGTLLTNLRGRVMPGAPRQLTVAPPQGLQDFLLRGSPIGDVGPYVDDDAGDGSAQPTLFNMPQQSA
jgi:ribA/ribD-fused uncharacterized protein